RSSRQVHGDRLLMVAVGRAAALVGASEARQVEAAAVADSMAAPAAVVGDGQAAIAGIGALNARDLDVANLDVTRAELGAAGEGARGAGLGARVGLALAPEF